MAYDLEHIASRGLLLSRFLQLAGKPRNFCFLAGCGGTRIATLRRLRLAASRCSQFAACSGAPSHRPPKAQDYAIMADYIRDLRPAKWGPMINLRLSALGLGCSLIPSARWLCRRRLLRCSGHLRQVTCSDHGWPRLKRHFVFHCNHRPSVFSGDRNHRPSVFSGDRNADADIHRQGRYWQQ